MLNGVPPNWWCGTTYPTNDIMCWLNVHFPHQSHCGKPVHGSVWNQGHQCFHLLPNVVSQVCRWPLCYSVGSMQQPILTTCELHSLSHTIYSREPQLRWTHTLFGHSQFHLNLTTHFSQLSTGHLPTQPSTFIGTATITYLLNIVYSTPLHTGLGLSELAHSCFIMKRNT